MPEPCDLPPPAVPPAPAYTVAGAPRPVDLARRTLLLAGAGLVVAQPAWAGEKSTPPAPASGAGVLSGLNWEAAFAADRLSAVWRALNIAPAEAPADLSLRVQDLAENGAAVPVSFGTPWAPARWLLLLVDRNPNVLSAAFELLPDGLEPQFNLRIKMAESSAVRLVAIDAEGQARDAHHDVTVILGSCTAPGAPDASPGVAPAPTLIRARHRDGRTRVRVLMSHPMESGHRQDEAGRLIPAWHIVDVELRCEGQPVLRSRWGPSVSRDPYLECTLRQARVGDRIEVRWRDNRGETRTDSARVEPA